MRVVNQNDPRKHFAIIPHVVINSLGPYELALYVHLTKTAGVNGACWKSTATLARESKISPGKISAAKTELAKPQAWLNGKALIVITEEPNTNGGKPKHLITLTDVWKENLEASSPCEREAEQVHHMNVQVQEVKFTSSPSELNKNPNEEEPLKKIELDPPHRGTDFLTALRAFENSRKNMKKPITPEARKILYKKLSTWDERTATEALEDSVMNRWQGVFEPKRNRYAESNRPNNSEGTFEFTPQSKIQ